MGDRDLTEQLAAAREPVTRVKEERRCRRCGGPLLYFEGGWICNNLAEPTKPRPATPPPRLAAKWWHPDGWEPGTRDEFWTRYEGLF